MIKARLNCTKNGHLSLSVKGHAGAAEVGYDLICASASMLAYTAAQLVKDYAKSGYLKGKARVLMKRGSSTITCTPKEEYFDEVYHTFYVVQTGLNLLAHNYPQYITLSMFGEA